MWCIAVRSHGSSLCHMAELVLYASKVIVSLKS